MLMPASLYIVLVVVFLWFPPQWCWCFVVFSSPLKKCEGTHSLTCTFNRFQLQDLHTHSHTSTHTIIKKASAQTGKNHRTRKKLLKNNQNKKQHKFDCNFLGTRFSIFIFTLYACVCLSLCVVVSECSWMHDFLGAMCVPRCVCVCVSECLFGPLADDCSAIKVCFLLL